MTSSLSSWMCKECANWTLSLQSSCTLGKAQCFGFPIFFLDLMVLDFFLFPLGLTLTMHMWNWTLVKPQKWSLTGTCIVLGEGGATLPNRVLWVIFFLGNWGSFKVVKDGMAIVGLALGRRLCSNSSWVITAMLVRILRYLIQKWGEMKLWEDARIMNYSDRCIIQEKELVLFHCWKTVDRIFYWSNS